MAWYWKSNLNKSDSHSDAWTAYSAQDTEDLEAAYEKRSGTGKKKKNAPTQVNLKNPYKYSYHYIVDIEQMLQWRSDDDQLQRAVKREEQDSDDEAKVKGPTGKKRKVTLAVRGRTFARTGTFSYNKAITEYIEKRGGHVSSSVTKDVDYVIANAGDDFNDNIGKAVTARKYKIPIVFLESDWNPADDEAAFKTAFQPQNMKYY